LSGTELLLALMLVSAQQHSAVASDEVCTKAAVFAEARGESLKGMRAVQQVVINRARRQGVSPCRVVKSPHQFSFYKRGMNLTKLGKDDSQFLTRFHKARRMRAVLTEDYTHYYRKDIHPSWAKRMQCDKVVGRQVFCRERKLT
jgi:spore germination cell wall hydrolase CwlJ-like protein